MTLREELQNTAGTAPLAIADLIMMEWLGRMNSLLPHLKADIRFDLIEQEIARGRAEFRDYSICEKLARKIANQQFGDPAAALRELAQNAIDAYELADVERRIDFAVAEEPGYTVLRVRDSGRGMNLAELVCFLLVPFNTNKEGDPNKIGEHGVGSFSFLGISDVVRYRSRRRGTAASAQALIYGRSHKLEALLSQDEAQMDAGTEVTLYLPPSAGFDRETILRQLYKFVGYVDPNLAEIFLDGERVNTLSAEYQHSLPENLTIAGAASPLVFSFSTRALAGPSRDSRFAERDMNLKNVVYTQAGLFMMYAPNPFDPRALDHRFFEDLTAMGLDFWVQVPAKAGLTISRNKFVSEHEPEILDAQYAAFRNLLLDSIVMDDRIMYGSSAALQEGIGRIVRGGYLDVARKGMIRSQPIWKRLFTTLLPIVQRCAHAVNAAIWFVFAAPLRLIYYGLLVPVSAAAGGVVRAVRRAGPRGVGKALVAAAAIMFMALVAGRYYERGFEREMESAHQRQLSVMIPGPPPEWRPAASIPAPFSEPIPPISPSQYPPVPSSVSPPQSQNPAPPPPFLPPPATVPQPAPPSPQLPPAPVSSGSSTNVVYPPPQPHKIEEPSPGPSLFNRVLDWTAAGLQATGAAAVRAGETARSVLQAVQSRLEGRLPFAAEYRSAVAASLVWTGAFLAAILLLLLVCRFLGVALGAIRIDPARLARRVGKVLFLPLYPLFLAGKGLNAAAREGLGLWENRVGLYVDVEERERRKIEARKQQVIAKYLSHLQTEGFFEKFNQKQFIRAVHCTNAPGQGAFLIAANPGQGEQVRISIQELIDLYVLRRIKRIGLDRGVRKGDYVVDPALPINRELLKRLDEIRDEVDDRFSPVRIEQRWELLKKTVGGIASLLYLVSGAGLVHIAVSLCYADIPNPYRNSPAYRSVAAMVAGSPRLLDLLARAMQGLFSLLAGAAMALLYAIYYVLKGIFYYLPVFAWRGASWTATNILLPVIASPLLLPGAWRELRDWNRQRATRRRAGRIAREQERARLQAQKEEERKRRREREEADRAAAAEHRARRRGAAAARREARKKEIADSGGRLSIMASRIRTACAAVGRGLHWLRTGYRANVTGVHDLDGEVVDRIATHAAVGHQYCRFLYAAQAVESLLSRALETQPLTITYRYPSSRGNMFGCLQDGKRPKLLLDLSDGELLSLMKECDSDVSRLCYTLFEMLLHHKAVQSVNRERGSKFPKHTQYPVRKEEFRKVVYRHLGGSGKALETCVTEAVTRTPRTEIAFVPPDEMARLSRFRVRGLIEERYALRTKYSPSSGDPFFKPRWR